MRTLGAGSGVEIVEDGQRLLVIDRRTASWHTAGFVFALLTGTPLIAGVALIASATVPWPVGLGLAGLGCVAGFGLRYIVRRARALAAVPAAEVKPTLVIDLGGGVLLDGAGSRLASLVEAKFGRKMQLGSSSPALAVTFGKTTIVFARGNPFAGGLGNLEDVLRRRGLMG